MSVSSVALLLTLPWRLWGNEPFPRCEHFWELPTNGSKGERGAPALSWIVFSTTPSEHSSVLVILVSPEFKPSWMTT